MCGIVGFISNKYNGNLCYESVYRMTNALVHRGPDDEGIWIDKDAGIALGHRRLSIVDLTHEGHQPMHSQQTGRYVIAFNGEIYNFGEIRNELDMRTVPAWRGHSDTEVMLAAFEEWGIEAAVQRFVGMFAFALWDKKERWLYLVRDRIGEKPLYYGWMDDTFLFGSELKALRSHPSWRGEIDRNALVLYLRYNYIPAPYSIYKNVYKLYPGTILKIDAAKGKNQSSIPKQYWQAKRVAENSIIYPFNGSEREAAMHLENLLLNTIRQEMVADVPLGAFLSGGIDSSTIVALMQAQSNLPVKTFTIGFKEEGYNEAEQARSVARHLKTEHTELYVTPEEAMSVIFRLPSLYDEPFSDSSQIPTYLVSTLARQYVSVSLSGDGGDELFAGYNRYFIGKSIWDKIEWMPKCMKNSAAALLKVLSPQVWEAMLQNLYPILPKKVKQRNPGDKLQKLADILNVDSPIEMYYELVSHWKESVSVVTNAIEPITVLTDRSQWADLHSFTETMMFLDMMTYLPDDILVKVDRAAMGVSLETRVPFLDHRVVEFAWRVPLSMKIRNGQGKWLLRQVLYKYVPKELIERPKTGFAIPLDRWLRGPLLEWAESLLNEKRLHEEGFFNPASVHQKLKEHLDGKRNWQYHLWDVLMFQAWLDQSKER